MQVNDKPCNKDQHQIKMTNKAKGNKQVNKQEKAQVNNL